MPLKRTIQEWIIRNVGGSLAEPSPQLLEAMCASPSDAGEYVNAHTALNIAIVWDCIQILASDISTTPIYVYRELPGNQRRLASDSQLMQLLNEQPNPEMTRVSFMTAMVLAMCVHGNAYAQIEWNNAGQPIALWPLNAAVTRPIRNNIDGELYYQTSDGVKLGDPIGFRYIPAEDVIHVPGILSHNGIMGISPIEHAKTSMGTALALDKHAARFFGNGSQPGWVIGIQGNPTPEQQKALREQLTISTVGRNQHKGIILPGDFKYQTITIPNDQAQFLESRKFTVDEICRWYRVLPQMVGEIAKSTGSSIEAQMTQHVTGTLQIYYTKFEQEFKRKLTSNLGRAAGQYDVRFYAKAKMRGDIATQTAFIQAMRQNGVMTANECRLLEEMNPLGPEGDVLTVPVTFQSAQNLLLPPDPIAEDVLKDEEEEQSGSVAGAKPLPTDTPNPDPDEDTESERYLPLVSDAIRRYSTRSDKGSESITKVFEPLLSTLIADYSKRASKQFGITATPNTERTIKEAAKSILTRSEKWSTDIDDVSHLELRKITKAILLDVFRQAGAQVALKGIDENK